MRGKFFPEQGNEKYTLGVHTPAPPEWTYGWLWSGKVGWAQRRGIHHLNMWTQKPSMLWRWWNYDLMKFWVKFRSSYSTLLSKAKRCSESEWLFSATIFCMFAEKWSEIMCPNLGSAYPSFTLGSILSYMTAKHLWKHVLMHVCWWLSAGLPASWGHVTLWSLKKSS